MPKMFKNLFFSSSVVFPTCFSKRHTCGKYIKKVTKKGYIKSTTMGSVQEFHILVHCFADPVPKKEVKGLHFDVLVLPLLYNISFSLGK